MTKMARTIPCNIEAEQCLLGAILINCQLLSSCSEFLKTEHFFETIHQKIYHAICVIVDKGFIATPVTLKSMLGSDPLFQNCGGSEYLSKLTGIAMMVVNVRDYAKILQELALKRCLIQIGEDIVNTAYDSSIARPASELIEQAEAKLCNLAMDGTIDGGFTKISSSVNDSILSINRAIKNSNTIIGIPSGFTKIDNVLAGFQLSDLIIIAGRPSMGKTAFAINLAMNAAQSLQLKVKDSTHLTESQIDEQIKAPAVGFFSLEMSSEQLAYRILSMKTNIDSAALRSGRVNEENYNLLRLAAVELSELPLFVDDTALLSISSIKARVRALRRKFNLGALFIDYLQLITTTTHKHHNRVLQISEITQSLKAIAKELSIPVIALSQLSRAVETRENRWPQLSDLRESGSIEQDADVVMFVYREEYYLNQNPCEPTSTKYLEWRDKLDKAHNVADVIIAKHRNGPTSNVKLTFDKRLSKFSN